MPRFHWHISDVHHERVDLSKKWRACSFAKGTYTSQRWSNVILSAPIRGAMGDTKHLTSNWSSWGLNLSSMVFTEEQLEILRLPLFVRSFVRCALTHIFSFFVLLLLVGLLVVKSTSMHVAVLFLRWWEYEMNTPIRTLVWIKFQCEAWIPSFLRSLCSVFDFTFIVAHSFSFLPTLCF